MSNIVNTPPLLSERTWRNLFEVALLEKDGEGLWQRIQDAQHAIMDEIEDSLQTASQIERQSMTCALNTLRELRGICEPPRRRVEVNIADFHDAT